MTTPIDPIATSSSSHKERATAEVVKPQNVELELSRLIFASQARDDVYRVQVRSAGDSMAVTIWLECKRTKLQRECKIENVKDFAPEGVEIPGSVVLTALKHALQANSEKAKKSTGSRPIQTGGGDHESHNATRTEASDTADVDLVSGTDGSVTLVLKVKLLPYWMPAYKFPMVPLAIETIDILQAQMRDLQEEIVELKSVLAERDEQQRRAKKHAPLSLRSTEVTAVDECVCWEDNGAISNGDNYALVDENGAVEVVREGLYRVYARFSWAGGEWGKNDQLCLFGDDYCIQRAVPATSDDKVPKTCTISGMVELKAGTNVSLFFHRGGGAAKPAGEMAWLMNIVLVEDFTRE